MTIDEAILHCEENVANGAGGNPLCASEHRQLADWLKELKKLKTFNDTLYGTKIWEDCDKYMDKECKG